MLINRIKQHLIIDIAVPLTSNVPKTEAEEIVKHEQTCPGKSRVSGSLTTYLFTPQSSQQEWSCKTLKYLENIGLTKSILRVGQTGILLQMSYSM